MTALAKGTAKIRISLGSKSKEFEIEVSDGDGLEYKTTDGDVYAIKSIKEKTVNVEKIDGWGLEKTIPDTVEIAGDIYKVVGIDGNAFKGNTKITKVTVGNNVKTIDSNTFSGCKKLWKVTLGKNVTSIGKGAFSGCKKLSRLHIKSTKLKKVGKNAFKGAYKKLVIKVPKKKLKAYKKLIKIKT